MAAAPWPSRGRGPSSVDMTPLRWIDYAVMVLYLGFFVGIGVWLRRRVRTSTDFFLSGRAMPAWVAGLAFISANLGAQEVIGMGASGAKYGIATSHFYWIGAIPAMVFVGLFMMPFYYGSRARSVPEYLKLRFDEKTRALNAISFAAMTVFSSGISMYAMGKLLNLLLGWSFDMSVLVSGVIVLAYIFMGGLTSAIYNEVLQFFLIVFGFAPLVILGLRDVGGWHGLVTRLSAVATSNGLPAHAYTESWRYMGHAASNPVGVEWFGLVMGLGFVLSFGYWCTDFLVVQRAMAAHSIHAARRTPLIAAVPKMLFPFLVIVPGMLAMAVTSRATGGAGGGGAGPTGPRGGAPGQRGGGAPGARAPPGAKPRARGGTPSGVRAVPPGWPASGTCSAAAFSTRPPPPLVPGPPRALVPPRQLAFRGDINLHRFDDAGLPPFARLGPLHLLPHAGDAARVQGVVHERALLKQILNLGPIDRVGDGLRQSGSHLRPLAVADRLDEEVA